MLLYYARPVWMTGRKMDEHVLSLIREEFPSAKVSATLDRGCRAKHKKMDRFFRMVDRADAIVVVPSTPDGRHLSSGVAAEAAHALHAGKPVYVVREDRKGAYLGRLSGIRFQFKGEKSRQEKWAVIRSKRI